MFYTLSTATKGVRPRSSLSLLPGLEFLDAIISNCLDWLPSNRPTAASLLDFLALNAPHDSYASLVRFEGSTSAASQLVAPLTTTKPLPQPSLATPSSSSRERSKDSEALSRDKSNVARGRSDRTLTPAGSKTSQAVATASEPGTSGGSGTGNPAYGKCEIEGCLNFKLRKHLLVCWRHRDRLLPSEMVIARALQEESLLKDVFPCDLVSCLSLAGRCQSLYGSMLPFAVVSALKVPSASLTFVTELEKAGKQDASHFLAALSAASSPQQTKPSKIRLITCSFESRFVCHLLCLIFK